MQETKKHRKKITFSLIALSVISVIGLFYIIIYYRYPLQREIVLDYYLIAIIISSLCFTSVLVAFANFIINNGEERERQGLPFFETKITVKKILINTFIILGIAIFYYWNNILDFDLSMKEEYSYINDATFVGENVSYSRFTSQNRWFYAFVNKENDTLILNSSSENPVLTKMNLNTKNLTVEYLPNTKSLQSVSKE